MPLNYILTANKQTIIIIYPFNPDTGVRWFAL